MVLGVTAFFILGLIALTPSMLQAIKRRSTGLLAALSSALLAMTTLIRMWVDWNQAPRSAQLDLKLRLAIAAAGFLTLLALILGIVAASKRR